MFCVQRQSGLVWYAKYRTGTGRQVQKKLGPAWTRRGRPPAGSFTRPVAEQWLCATLERNRARTTPPDAGTRALFDEAAAEWLRYIEHDRRRKPTTVRGYRTLLEVHVLPEFGGMLLTEITTEQIGRWAWGISCAATTRLKVIVCLSGIYHRVRRVWGLTYDPVDEVQRPPIKRDYDVEVYSPGEVLALRWRDVDLDRHVLRVRASWSGYELTFPKAGRVRSVPLAPQVADALRPAAPGELVFPGRDGNYLDRSALRPRYRAAQRSAGLRQAALS